MAAVVPAPNFAYPPTRTEAVVDRLHGVEVRDPYRWLETVSSPEVQSWMAAQNAFARAELAKLPDRDALAARLSELRYIDVVAVPQRRGGHYFIWRRSAKSEKGVVYWKASAGAPEKTLLDPNAWAADGSSSLGVWSVTRDGKRVAYQVKKNNSDEATLYVMDVATGTVSDVDVIEGAKYASPSWTPAGDGFYYTWVPTDPSIPATDRLGHAVAKFHRLGADPAHDVVVHEALGDPTKFLGVQTSHDGKWLTLDVSGWDASDVYFREANATPAEVSSWRPLAVGRGAHFQVVPFKGVFYVFTDEGAPRGRLFAVDPHRPTRHEWKEIVAEDAEATLQGVSVIGGKLVLGYLVNATSRVEVRELDGRKLRRLELPGIGQVDGPYGDEDHDEAFFSFQSFTTPYEVHETSIATGRGSLVERIKAPLDATPYEVEQVFYRSKDGTRVSMFVVRRRDLVKDGSNRVLLAGYGGFNISELPVFMPALYAWLERGGVFALPNLRGGGEYGEAWHKAGTLSQKQNVFDDYVAAAEYLIAEKYTRPGRLAIRGGSNGGLLMGAAMTQRPELFGAVLCGVPLLDMVRYHLSGSGKSWVSEYGSADDAAQFAALYAYSPYHHVSAGVAYPATLVLSADSDDRVDPMHARKFAAELQARSTGGEVLLRIEKHAGHGGADLVKSAVEADADGYAFALAHTPDAPAAH